MSSIISRHSSARRVTSITAKILMIASAIVLFSLGSNPRATAGEDPLPEALDRKHRNHTVPIVPPPQSPWQLVWSDNFDDGSFDDWKRTMFTIYDIVELVPDGNGWCLHAASLDDAPACGYIVNSPDLDTVGLNYGLTYRIDFRFMVPEVCNLGTTILRSQGVTLVMDEVDPISLVGQLSWIDIMQERHRLGQIKLGRWNELRIVVAPVVGRPTWARFTVHLNGRNLGSGEGPKAPWKNISLFHPPFELSGSAPPAGQANGGGYWDDFAVYSREDPHRGGGRVKIVPTVAPNPANPSTTIRFDLEHESHLTVDVFTVDGRRVICLWNGWTSAGLQSFTWDGRDASGSPVSSGVYYGRITTPNLAHTVRLTVLK